MIGSLQRASELCFSDLATIRQLRLLFLFKKKKRPKGVKSFNFSQTLMPVNMSNKKNSYKSPGLPLISTFSSLLLILSLPSFLPSFPFLFSSFFPPFMSPFLLSSYSIQKYRLNLTMCRALCKTLVWSHEMQTRSLPFWRNHSSVRVINK